MHGTCTHHCSITVFAFRVRVWQLIKVCRVHWVCYCCCRLVCEDIGQDGERSQRDCTVLQGFVHHFEHPLLGELAAPQGKKGRGCTRMFFFVVDLSKHKLAIKQTYLPSFLRLSSPAHRPSHPRCRNIPASGGEQLCLPHG